MNRENFKFGSGSYVGETSQNPDFFDLPTREQARLIGWAIGCPVVDKLTDPLNTDAGRGPEAMLVRYGEVGFWFTFIAREVEQYNPLLNYEFRQAEYRRDDEPVHDFEPESVPPSYATQIPPTETHAGYALPRLFIEQLGSHQEITPEQRLERLERGLDALKTAIQDAWSADEILAFLAEDMLELGDVEPKKILSHVLSLGWQKQHNAIQAIESFKNTLRTRTPDLWAIYENLSPEEKAQSKLA